MAISYIIIENFKGIGAPIRIDFKPITLLYGPNSVGKSTILHALMYAYEVLKFNNFDADRVTFSDEIDLGGFRSLVHGHDLSRRIRITIGVTGFIGSTSEGVELAVEVAWDRLNNKPYSSELRLSNLYQSRDGELVPVESCSLSYGGELGDIPRLNVKSLQERFPDSSLARSRERRLSILERLFEKDDFGYLTSVEGGRVPDIGARGPASLILVPRDFEVDEEFDFEKELDDFVESILIRPIRSVVETLDDELLYIGPLRELPQRNYVPLVNPLKSRWSAGLAAWDLLHNGPDELVKDASEALYGMKSGYFISRKKEALIDLESDQFKAVKRALQENDSETAMELLQGFPVKRSVSIQSQDGVELLPKDVGTGISQVLPILVSANMKCGKLIAVEQPELHIHPAMQLEIADVLVRSAAKSWTPILQIWSQSKNHRNHHYLIETHSEHLLLRLLRRIKQTNEKYAGDVGEARENRQRDLLFDSEYCLYPIQKDDLAISNQELAVYYVDSAQGQTTLTELPVSADGDFEQEWPKGFFEEREEELFH